MSHRNIINVIDITTNKTTAEGEVQYIFSKKSFIAYCLGRSTCGKDMYLSTLFLYPK